MAYLFTVNLSEFTALRIFLFFWSLSLFLFILFSLKNPLTTNLNHNNFLPLTKLASIAAF